jgi:lysophospholipase L1-like esterase
VIGDSLVTGVGDAVNEGSGGYVLRAQQRFPASIFFNEGTAGLRTTALLKRLKKTFSPGQDSPLKQRLISADLVVIDLGRNDRWFFGPPAQTLRNLKRIRSSIATEVTAATGFAPLIVQAVLMYPNRGSQGPWVKELDDLIYKSHTSTEPADLRFDLVSKRLLNPDNIHPSSKGYVAMAKVFISYLLSNYPRYVAAIRADADNDGLYDDFESSRYGTSPANPDSDGDGLKDGDDPTPAG